LSGHSQGVRGTRYEGEAELVKNITRSRRRQARRSWTRYLV
jgi:hypothetical protein